MGCSKWPGADNRGYAWYLPAGYDQEKGANLVFFLHGNNMSRYWGLANVRLGTFRPDDILVSLDGSTSNGQGGFNWNSNVKELEQLDALQKELEKTFKVRATYLYGHSQGAFMVHYWAGHFLAESICLLVA